MSKKNKENKAYYDFSIGDCLRFTKSGLRVFKSKYQTQEDAKEVHDRLSRIGIYNHKHNLYKCTECHCWHIGTEKESEL